jgi:GntR family transcriptional repressor for pyruvate dehydrogenase complex
MTVPNSPQRQPQPHHPPPPQPPPAPPAPLVSEQVFATLLEALLCGRYAPGEKLPRQRELAADLDVTLGSLREALKRLEQMGLIEVRHGDATRVRDWRQSGGLDVLAHLLFRGGTVDGSVLEDVLEARALMLRELAALAAERRSDDDAARITALARDFAAHPQDAVAAAYVDFAFFTAITAAAGNLVFVLILNAIRDLYLGHIALVPVTAEPRALAPLYDDLAAAIERADADHARVVAYDLACRQRDLVRAALQGLLGTAEAA